MNREQQIEKVKELFECKTQKEAKEVYGKILELVEDVAIAEGTLGNHVTFKHTEVEAKPERMGMNPKDPKGAKIKYKEKPAYTKVSVKVNKGLKDAVNK